MAESRPVYRPWQPEDPLEAVRLQAMQDLAESAQLSAASPNVHIHKSPNGAGMSIAVDAVSAGRITAVIVQITGEASGGGQYVGKILRGASTADGIGPLVMPEGMTIPDTDDALILHPPESASHNLPSDGSLFVIGKVSGTVATGTHEGKQIVVMERVVTPTTFAIYRMTVGTGPTTSEPRIVIADPVAGGLSATVRCVVGHDVGDTIFAYEPTGGTGLSGASMMEVGVDGQDFEVLLTHVGGTGTLADAYTYHCDVGGSRLTGTAIAATRSGSDSSLQAWQPVLAASPLPAKLGRARFLPTGVVELVVAFDTHTVLVPVTLEGGTVSPSGSTPSTITYTVKEVEAPNATIATGASVPRPFGDDFLLTAAATYGWGYWTFDGSFVLLAAGNEVFKTTDGCS